VKQHLITAALLVLVAGWPAIAQQTTGNITGRVLDEQNAAIPGATITAKNPATGFTRVEVTDAEGAYRLTALPIGVYDIKAELQGFTTVDKLGIIVNVSTTITIDFGLKVAALAETVNVRGAMPLIETSSSSVGGIVDVKRIESLPLNGRQFANLAATIPGVGLGFHTDPTKSTQYSPQINGGNGRNVNYQIDGGDNNDDTVGGLLQLYPLEAIQEFNFLTARYKAEYGRSNGGVLNVVTKSGTNQNQGSFFELFRDTKMNARTETEELTNVAKQQYRRNQFGGSFGGPITQNKAHFFAAIERTQQDTFQSVTTRGLFPSLDGVFPLPYRENLVTGKGTTNLNPAQYLSVRYGYNHNSQPYGVTPNSPPNAWGTSTNEFHSINLNHNWVVAGARLNEFIFQYASFANAITTNSFDPRQTFPNSVAIGQNANAPQRTEQQKWQFRDDFSWHAAGGGGLSHDFKAGVNFINEPRLFFTANIGTGGYAFGHLTNDIDGPLSSVTRNGGSADASLKMKQFGVYWQDDWRVSSKLTLNLGVRYDLIDGFAIDQSKNPNFVILDQAGRAGLLANSPGFEDFGKDPAEDRNNLQPRVGLAYDVRGNGRDVLRGGYGRYYDFSYTNNNLYLAAPNANGKGFGQIFSVSNTSGIRNPNGSFFRVSDPINNIAALNDVNTATLPIGPDLASPRIRQPYNDQFSAGWSHQLDTVTVIDVDYVHSEGHDYGLRMSLNQRDPGVGPTGPRHYSTLLAQFGTFSPAAFLINVSDGKGRYDGLTFAMRRQMAQHMQFSAWYSLQRALSMNGRAIDELTDNVFVNHLDPFADVQFGPSGGSSFSSRQQGGDIRHRLTVSGVVELPLGFQVAPIFRFRTAIPLNIIQGVDLNQNGVNNDLSSEAFAFDGFDSNHNPIVKGIGECKTINCGRGTSQSQMNLRVSKSFHLAGSARVEAIGEIFNLFNAINPGVFNPQRFIGTFANPQPNPDFMRPTVYAGDFRQGEQRVGQIGLRFTF
jgi:Carboxypeptidase regulatory-like domain/TonB dependent receptor-like, beta-barrel